MVQRLLYSSAALLYCMMAFVCYYLDFLTSSTNASFSILRLLDTQRSSSTSLMRSFNFLSNSIIFSFYLSTDFSYSLLLLTTKFNSLLTDWKLSVHLLRVVWQSCNYSHFMLQAFWSFSYYFYKFLMWFCWPCKFISLYPIPLS